MRAAVNSVVVAAALGLGQGAADAQTTPVDLSINGTQGAAVIWSGPQANGSAGAALVRGDLNGDVNRPDLIIGAPGGGSSAQGQVFATFMGPKRSGSVDLSTSDVIVTGAATGDQFGTAIGTGQVFTRQTDVPTPARDLVVAAPAASSGKGAVYLFKGPFVNGDRRAAAAADFKVVGAAGDRLGTFVDTADVNGDGYRDVIIGAPANRRVYIIFGKPSLAGVWDLSTQPADVVITLPAALSAMTEADFNNDGFADVALGFSSMNGGAGAVYVLTGRASAAWAASLSLTTAATATLSGIDAADAAGFSLDIADYDGDAVADLVIGAPNAAGPNNTRPGSGEAYVVFGGSTARVTAWSIASASVTIFGAAAGQHFATAINHGNITRDIWDDLAFLTPGGSTGGDVDIVYGGPRSSLSQQMDLAAGIDRVLRGDPSAGPIEKLVVLEVTGEGANDIVVGVPRAANGTRTGAGLSYTAFSPNLTANPVTLTVAQGATTSASTAIANAGTGSVAWAIRSNTSWLDVSPSTGISGSAPGTTSLIAAGGRLPTGTYQGSFVIISRSRDLDLARVVPVTLTVTPGTPTGPTFSNPFGVPDPPDEGSPSGVSTPVGTNVAVLPVRDVLVTFSAVTVAGATTVNVTSSAAPAAPGFTVGPWTYAVSTTAMVSGPISVAVAYDSSVVKDWEGMVRLWQGGTNITTRVDPVRHIVYGTTSSLSSPFVVADDPRGITIGSDQTYAYFGGTGVTGTWSVFPLKAGQRGTDFFLYNTASGQFKQMVNNGLGMFRIVNGQWSPGWSITPIDLNHDGFDDLFVYNAITGVWVEVLNDRQGGFTYVVGQWSPGWSVYAADLDGDGTTDLFVYNAATGTWVDVFVRPGPTFAYVVGQWSPGWQVYPADLNGDGKTDLFLYSAADGRWVEAFSAGANGFTYAVGQWSVGWSIKAGDFNGDRRTDLLVYNASSGTWVTALSMPSGFQYAVGSWPTGLDVQVGDLDGDGKADVFVYRSGAWAREISDGAGRFVQTAGQWTPGWTVALGDVNGDGSTDVLLLNPATGQWFNAVANGSRPGVQSAAGQSQPGIIGPDGTTVDVATGNPRGQWSPQWSIVPLHQVSQHAENLFLYNPVTGQWFMGLNDTTGNFTFKAGQWSAGWQQIPVDLNHDGSDDVLLFNPGTGTWVEALADGAGGFRYLVGRWFAGAQLTLADLDGDGIRDVFAYNPTTGQWIAALNRGDAGFANVGGQWSAGWQIQAADLNRDGRDDIFVYSQATGRWVEALSTGNGGFTYVVGQWSAGWSLLAGDFDGDGATDLLVYNATTGAWVQALNRGSAGFVYVSGTSLRNARPIIADFNGDGRADLIFYAPQTGSWAQLVSVGQGFAQVSSGQWAANWTLVPVDINGDGRDDLFGYRIDTGAWMEFLTR